MRMRRAFSVAVNRILAGIRIMAAAASQAASRPPATS